MSEQIPSQSENSPDLLGDILGKILSPQPQTARETATAENITSGTGGVTGAINSQNPVGDIFSSLLSNPSTNGCK